MLDIASHVWSSVPGAGDVTRREVAQRADYSFDLSVFDGLDPAATALFVAFDERFGNFKRMELMQAAMERGFRLESLVSPRAVLGGGARVGPNAFVGDGAVVGSAVVIEYNVVVHGGAQIGHAARLRASAWIEGGTIVGARADVGAHAIVRSGAQVVRGVRIGRGCELGIARVYAEEVPAKTVFDPRYDEPIRVYGG
ncbi:MAG: UDP-3-O-(3-hydroxymyristoyl)glucosamine N-acyltransferase [Burkholderiales bacterium]|nr:UDP-3-O-(3-hydroxymyristoyl)glucosamine N-acyltransferase [Burkholderiales bacterium]